MSKVKLEPSKVKPEPEGNANATQARASVDVPELSYEEKVANCTVIAKPMASKKLAKRCYRLIRKAVKHKTYVRCGLKDVQKRLRKGEIGIVIFAGDVTPIDIMCHLPAVCEEKNIPYVYVPSRKDLGAALGVKRGCLTVLIRENEEYLQSFNAVKEEITYLPVAL